MKSNYNKSREIEFEMKEVSKRTKKLYEDSLKLIAELEEEIRYQELIKAKKTKKNSSKDRNNII